MHIAILCPGPSLNLQFAIRNLQFDLLIAVNRAATAFPADVWACGDPDLLRRERSKVPGLPELFTTAATAWQLEEAETPWPRDVTLFESLYRFCPVPQWQTFTFTAALVYAAYRIDAETRRRGDAETNAQTPSFSASPRPPVPASPLPRVITIFGCDWQGESDFDGQTGPEIAGNRRPERWQLERNITQNLLVPWLRGRGIVLDMRRGDTGTR